MRLGVTYRQVAVNPMNLSEVLAHCARSFSVYTVRISAGHFQLVVPSVCLLGSPSSPPRNIFFVKERGCGAIDASYLMSHRGPGSCQSKHTHTGPYRTQIISSMDYTNPKALPRLIAQPKSMSKLTMNGLHFQETANMLMLQVHNPENH